MHWRLESQFKSYEDIYRAASDLQADFFIFGASPSHYMHVTPLFQEYFLGYTKGFSPVAAFDLDSANKLIYFPAVPDWLDHRVSTRPVLDDGTPLSAAFRIDPELAPEPVHRAWKMLTSLIRQYRTEFPQVLIILDGAFEYARCATSGDCIAYGIKPAPAAGGSSGGGTFFERRLTRLCRDTGATCSLARDQNTGFSVYRRNLIYENDFHYTRFGNYWLADTIAGKMYPRPSTIMRHNENAIRVAPALNRRSHRPPSIPVRAIIERHCPARMTVFGARLESTRLIRQSAACLRESTTGKSVQAGSTRQHLTRSRWSAMRRYQDLSRPLFQEC